MAKQYQYKSPASYKGLGIPGLPHSITMEEAETRGVVDILKAAIANGSYIEVKPKVKKTSPKAEE